MPNPWLTAEEVAQEKLEVTQRLLYVVGGEARVVGIIHEPERAKRVAACVNFCQGVPTATLLDNKASSVLKTARTAQAYRTLLDGLLERSGQPLLPPEQPEQ